MKKNGFTLIEALAVIIILGIIMLIAVPSVSKYILNSDRSTYASDVSAYLETARAEYEMKEYGTFLKDDEVMIVPIEYIELEKGSKESPFGEFDLTKSYVVIAPYKNGYQYYANVVDSQGKGVVMKAQNELNKEAVEDGIENKIEPYESYYDSTVNMVINKNIYQMCEIRDIETNERVEEDAIIVMCSTGEFNNPDEVEQVVNIKAENQSGKEIKTNTYTNSGLDFTFTKKENVSPDSKIYYCQDTTNTCIPDKEVEEGRKLSDYNTLTNTYFIRYKIVGKENMGLEYSYKAMFDLEKPICTFKEAPVVYVNKGLYNLEMECNDSISKLQGMTNTGVFSLSKYTIDEEIKDKFTFNTSNLKIEEVIKETSKNGLKYSVALKGLSHGDTVITLNADAVKDNAENGNESISTNVVVNGVFKITLNNQSATSAGTGEIYELYNDGWYSDSNVTNKITSITKPAKNGYIFGGYYTGENGSGTQIIDANGNIKATKTQFLSDVTIYAKWNECGNGSYCANNVKTACPVGTYGNGVTTASTQAEACQNCGNGAWCTGGTARSLCPAGTVGNGTTTASTQAAACKACPAGYYCTGGTNQTACGVGKIRATTGGKSASDCTTCAAGTYSTANVSTSCSNCGNGAWCTGGSARSLCPAGTYGNGATKAKTQAEACQNCGNGYYCTGGTARTACPAGTVGNGTTTGGSQSASCKACPAGYYCTGETNQTACGAGKYRTTTGGKSASDCTTCAAGTYATANVNTTGCSNCGNGAWCTGGSARSTCPAGTYGNGATKAKTQAEACQNCGNGYYCTGGTARTACPAGTVGNGTTTGGSQSASCKACPAGYYCTGGTNQTTCGAGKYRTTTGGKSASDCTTCAAGTYSTANVSTSCSNCGNGAWCTGGSARSLCPAGTYGNGATKAKTQAEACQNCGNGAWCTGGTARSTCPAGTVGNGTTTASTQAAACKACPKGYYCTGGTAQTACGAGKYRTTTGGKSASDCTTCAAGTYATANVNTTGCSNCGNGAWCTGGSARSTCPAGTVGNGATTASTQTAACKACPAGYYCTGGTNQTACPAGKYRSTTGGKNSNDCSTCSSCYTSAAGASGCYDNSAPVANAWASTTLRDTAVNNLIGKTTIGNLGSDCGNGLKTIEYYTTCSSGSTTSTKTATISSNQATISINACVGAVLYYRLYDGNNYSSWVGVDRIGMYLIYGMEYNHFLGHVPAYNGSNDIGYHVGQTSSKVADRLFSAIGSVAISNNSSIGNQAYAQKLYLGILGRGADSSGLSGWTTALNNGTSRSDVLKSFINSTEAQGTYSAWGYAGAVTEPEQTSCSDYHVCSCCGQSGDYCTYSTGCASYNGQTGYYTCWRRNPACY